MYGSVVLRRSTSCTCIDGAPIALDGAFEAHYKTEGPRQVGLIFVLYQVLLWNLVQDEIMVAARDYHARDWLLSRSIPFLPVGSSNSAKKSDFSLNSTRSSRLIFFLILLLIKSGHLLYHSYFWFFSPSKY